MITEATIEQSLARLESEVDIESGIERMSAEQPELFAYLVSDDAEAFTEAERELLLFAALVVYESAPGTQPVAGEAITRAEEENYHRLSLVKAATFRDRLTPFFESTDQEDLLAFVEDLTVAEGEDEVSAVAREPFFVTLKTVIDTLT